jgi:ATP-dependent Clp protease ATP-binding subunit ClpC
VDFRNTVLIMTSNLGTEFVRKAGSLGFLQQTEDDEVRKSHEKIEKALKSTFRPEFLNRIDEIITFSSLTPEQMLQIVDLQMQEVADRLEEQGMNVRLTPAARKWLAEVGYDPSFGARPLKRALQKHVESPLSVKILSGEFTPGNTVVVDFDEESQGLTFTQEEIQTAIPSPVNTEAQSN